MSTKQAVKDAGDNLNMLLVIGFLGIVWLMIYGNLSGNIGFGTTSSSYVNQTITLNDSASPAGTYGKVNPSLSGVIITNASNGAIVPTTNYTVTGAVIANTTASPFTGKSVNVSYTVTYDTDGKVNTETVISNMTGGTKTFFGFSNTLFTIAAIVLLISILLGLVAVVMKIVNASKGNQKFANY